MLDIICLRLSSFRVKENEIYFTSKPYTILESLEMHCCTLPKLGPTVELSLQYVSTNKHQALFMSKNVSLKQTIFAKVQLDLET